MIQPISLPLIGFKTPMGRLKKQAKDGGHLESRDLKFYVSVAFHLLLFAACFLALLLGLPLWMDLAIALPTAFLSTQLAFHVHDILHGQAPRKGRNWLGGLLPKLLSVFLGNVLVGLSREWWQPKHDSHHKYPNHIEKDPDVDSLFFCLDEEQLENRKGLALFFASHQHRLLPVLAFFQAYSFRYASIKHLSTNGFCLPSLFGFLGLVIHYVLYGWLIFHLGVSGILFALVHQALFGAYNTFVFAPNHKGMPMNVSLDFFRTQVKTARNIRGGRFVSYVTGGLDLQIEHHLFPGVPRVNLRGIQPLVKELCEDLGETYTEAYPLESVKQWMGALKRVAKSAQEMRLENAMVK